MFKKKDISSKKTESKILDKKELFDALGRAESGAIRQLSAQIMFSVRQAANNAKLSNQDAEELVNDAILVTLKNIRTGKYQFQNLTPSAYANGVVRNLILNRIRSKKLVLTPLTGAESIPDFSADEYVEKKEREKTVGDLLEKLGASCQKILRLKKFKDQEIIDRQLIAFSSINSLKSKRSQCMKQLINLGKAGV